MLTDKYFINENPTISSKQGSLFSDLNYYKLHTVPTQRSFLFQSCSTHTKQPVMQIYFHEKENGILSSPLKGSFGGLEVFESVPMPIMYDFTKEVCQRLKEKEIKKIEITSPPQIYNPHLISEIQFVYHSLGFQIYRAEINFSIAVQTQDFQTHIDHGNRKKLRIFHDQGCQTRQLDPSDYKQAYDLIAANRERKKYTLSMSWSQLQETINLFPEQTYIFGSFLKDKMISAAICFQVLPHVLYVFYWAEDENFLHLSPVTGLAEALYKVAQDKKITILDLGVSSIESTPNWGLIRYKTNLGGIPSLKYYYGIHL